MTSSWLLISLQALVALGLFNVWLLRPLTATPYRGKDAQNLREEFAAYGLPEAAFWVVGGLKVAAGVILMAGILLPLQGVVTLAAGTVVVLMVGALAMHLKVGDPMIRSVPALIMLVMSGSIVLLG